MAQLLAIYAALAALPVTFTDGAGNARSIAALPLDETPQAVDSAIVPVRLLQPFGARGEGQLEARYTPGPGVLGIEWGIADMLFWASAGSGIGLAAYAADLVRYKAAYLEIIRSLGTSQYWVSAWVATVDTFEWPAESGQLYHGVNVRLTVRELT
jgi:hypothetical protein